MQKTEAPAPAPAPNPQQGGAWVRLPDGSLVPDAPAEPKTEPTKEG